MKKNIALILCISMILSMNTTIFASVYTPKYTEEADTLYELGLFAGTGKNADGTPIYSLEREATRVQGLVMLLRLLGKEAEAATYTGDCPFTDVPSWARNYVAYAYNNGITKGTSATTFGSNSPLLGKAYMTFVLKSLGYSAESDFNYNEALILGETLGLNKLGEYTGSIYRDECVKISCNALKTKMKDSEVTLLDKLVGDGIVTKEKVQSSEILAEEFTIPVWANFNNNGRCTNKFKIVSEHILKVLPNAKYVGCGSVIEPIGHVDENKISKFDIAFQTANAGGYNASNFYKKMDIAKYPETTYEMNPENCFITFSIYDKNYNMIAYSHLLSNDFHEVDTDYDWANAEFTFRTCEYSYNDYKNDEKQFLRELESMLDNELNDDILYVEDVITVRANGSESKSRYLRVDEEKYPEAAYYTAYPTDSHSIEGSLLSDKAEFNMGIIPLDTPATANANMASSVYWNMFGNEVAFYLYDENREFIGYIYVDKELPVVETRR